MESEIEDFHLHLVTIAYGDSVPSVVKEECWTLGLPMVRVLWRELRMVRMESEMPYGSNNQSVMVSQYLWGTLLAHRVMDEFLLSKLLQHPEVVPHINIYLFHHW